MISLAIFFVLAYMSPAWFEGSIPLNHTPCESHVLHQSCLSLHSLLFIPVTGADTEPCYYYFQISHFHHYSQIHQNAKCICKTPKSSSYFQFIISCYSFLCLRISKNFRFYFLKYSQLWFAIPFCSRSWPFSTGHFWARLLDQPHRCWWKT